MARTFRLAVSAVALIALAACDSTASSGGDGDGTTPTATASTTAAPNLSDHESGPESPIGYGLYVPQGATQLGPLFRYRSSRLIAAYRPELQALEAQRAAEAAEKVAEDEANGTPSPTPTPTTRPSPDSFKLIGDDAPRPDTSISLMRIDGDPTDVVRRMLAQIDAAIPDANLVLDDLSQYCTSQDRRVTGCQVVARGMTEGEREIRVTMSVDAGDLATRTASPGSMTRPVMQLTAEYVGDPRAGQLGRDTGKLEDVTDIDDLPDRSGLIWPQMDLDADTSTPLVNGWTAPESATLLLSGYRPAFVAMTTERAVDADQIAEQYAVANSRKGTVTKDVVEDLNSVSTMYAVRTKDGSIARSVYILSARGNYTALFYTPATN
ncbi:hypothetical protein IFT73_10375 [Aeromicrobium sp. CFBP 8757]|uniref:hypothetical protein n=1 Tax=Aeromicrobium sp. CFBP 8757 TaxID=2775288 RepID=UPI00178149D6|nr:hypothetical protein [Aeromicrobium sp. CFBP 8757]MBD8607262.1 hypothetical protein [Aeromicrobium sp. CFBP 8757]